MDECRLEQIDGRSDGRLPLKSTHKVPPLIKNKNKNAHGSEFELLLESIPRYFFSLFLIFFITCIFFLK